MIFVIISRLISVGFGYSVLPDCCTVLFVIISILIVPFLDVVFYWIVYATLVQQT